MHYQQRGPDARAAYVWSFPLRDRFIVLKKYMHFHGEGHKPISFKGSVFQL